MTMIRVSVVAIVVITNIDITMIRVPVVVIVVTTNIVITMTMMTNIDTTMTMMKMKAITSPRNRHQKVIITIVITIEATNRHRQLRYPTAAACMMVIAKFQQYQLSNHHPAAVAFMMVIERYQQYQRVPRRRRKCMMRSVSRFHQRRERTIKTRKVCGVTRTSIWHLPTLNPREIVTPRKWLDANTNHCH